jgi:chemotaxis protein methyltransferase CheR
MSDSGNGYLPVITPEQFLKFRDFYYRKTGTYFDESKRYFVDKRLLERIMSTECEGFRDYFVMLRFETGGQELQKLINLMTVNETYFFREEYQFKCLVNSLLPELVKWRTKGELLRVWSMPCSTGEEPYSIAIYLLEHWPDIDRYDIEIMASDIDTNALAAAQAGEYQYRAVAQLPVHLLSKYFIDMGDNRYIVKKDIRDSITFNQANVVDYLDMRHFRDLDIIFCRNLLIYFDDTSRRLAAEALYDALRPGGFICLGHSESMSRITPLFEVCKFPDAIVYQKPRRTS